MTPGSTSSCPVALLSASGPGQPYPCCCQRCPASHHHLHESGEWGGEGGREREGRGRGEGGEKGERGGEGRGGMGGGGRGEGRRGERRGGRERGGEGRRGERRGGREGGETSKYSLQEGTMQLLPYNLRDA